MLGDIDLIFGLWVYNEELQIKFTFRSDPMIVGRVMALGLWNLAKYLVVTTKSISPSIAKKVVTTKYLAKFQSSTAVSWPKIIQPKRISKLICNLWIYTLIPKSSQYLKFFAIFGDIELIFGIWVYNDELQIKFTFRSDPMIFGRVMALGLGNLPKYLVVTTLFHYDLRYKLISQSISKKSGDNCFISELRNDGHG
jgi:hypothetical protein